MEVQHTAAEEFDMDEAGEMDVAADIIETIRRGWVWATEYGEGDVLISGEVQN